MDIEKYLTIISNSNDKNDIDLVNSINDAITILHDTINKYDIKSISLSFNGGKDSTVVLHLLRLALQPIESEEVVRSISDIRIVYFEPPAESPNFQEVISFITKTEDYLNVKIDILHGGFKKGMSDIIKEGARCVIVGTRRIDPDGRFLEGVFCPTSLNWPPMMRVCPALDLTYSDVWAVLLGANLPFCSLYSEGYTSIGSVYDTLKNPSLLIPIQDLAENKEGVISNVSTEKNLLEVLSTIHISSQFNDITSSTSSSSSSSSSSSVNQIEIFLNEASSGKRTHLPAWFLKNDELERLGRK
jgi:3'-phosphoadenosine 5'-phosphosulfate sulfotransferase (PAPS reductase)/FAD synthetase